MEDMLWKFPHIGENIFKKLSNSNLAKCKKVTRAWEYFINNERFYKQKVKYEMIQKDIDEKGRTQLHKVAEAGNFLKCSHIIDHVEEKNPQDNYRVTPLHLAAGNGHISICKLILENIQDKNPLANKDVTPLHYAANAGQFDVFKLIFENAEDKNPSSIKYPISPLHLAASKGHFDICKLVIDNLQDENLCLSGYSVLTPLLLATLYDHDIIVNYMKSKIKY